MILKQSSAFNWQKIHLIKDIAKYETEDRKSLIEKINSSSCFLIDLSFLFLKNNKFG